MGIERETVNKVNRLISDGNWKTYNIGAEAQDVIARNGDYSRESVQSIIFKDMKPIIYTYGQDIYNAQENIYEKLTWENIQLWLNEGRIRDFLKEGDCIEVTLDKTGLPAGISGNFPTIWHFWVIGINTHNGQSKEALDANANHIDFCGGSYAELRDAAFSLSGFTLSSTENSLISPTFLYTSTNNGKHINDITNYGNFFVDNPLIKENDGVGDTTNYGDITISTLNSLLGMDRNFLCPKILYLDQRYTNVFEFIEAICNNISGNYSVKTFLQALADTYSDILAASSSTPFEILYNKYAYLLLRYNSFFGKGDGWTSAIAMALLRISADLDYDDLIEFMEQQPSLTGWKDSKTALSILRLSVGLPPFVLEIPSQETEFRAIIQAKSEGKKLAEKYNDPQQEDDYDVDLYNSLVPYTDMLDTLDLFEKLCQAAYLWEGEPYKLYSEKAIRYSNKPLWSLTEKEFFGECTFSNPKFAQGQIFQYPIFQNMQQRKNITTDLKARGNRNQNIRMILINPAENSNQDAVGMDIETLMPTTYSVVTTKTENNVSYPIDMPICFRMQQNTE